MIANDIVVAYRKRMHERLDELSGRVTSGKVGDWPRYKEMTGRIAGINEALDELTEVIKHYAEMDYDD